MMSSLEVEGFFDSFELKLELEKPLLDKESFKNNCMELLMMSDEWASAVDSIPGIFKPDENVSSTSTKTAEQSDPTPTVAETLWDKVEIGHTLEKAEKLLNVNRKFTPRQPIKKRGRKQVLCNRDCTVGNMKLIPKKGIPKYKRDPNDPALTEADKKSIEKAIKTHEFHQKTKRRLEYALMRCERLENEVSQLQKENAMLKQQRLLF